LGIAYGYGYYEALSIPLVDLKEIMPNAVKEYERKMLLREAILKYLGVSR